LSVIEVPFDYQEFVVIEFFAGNVENTPAMSGPVAAGIWRAASDMVVSKEVRMVDFAYRITYREG
jgi:hypothetical protein